jgi:predicted Zn-dependent peptidase
LQLSMPCCPLFLSREAGLYPEYLTLQRELEKLYGAELGTDIIKSGERHILAFTLETAHDQYLGSNGKLLQQGMGLLGSVVGDPLLVDGAFRQDYVTQEKSQLIKDIKALLNDKASYAMERCLSLMCADEPFGVFKLGRVEDYEAIESIGLYNYYREIFRVIRLIFM